MSRPTHAFLHVEETAAYLPSPDMLKMLTYPMKFTLTTFPTPGQVWPHFLPGQTIVGTVTLEAERESRVLGVKVSLNGFAHVRLTGGLQGDKVERETYLDFEENLLGDFVNPSRVPAGVTELPFQFHLPVYDLPCSYDGDHGKVVYVVMAVVTRVPDSMGSNFQDCHEIKIDTRLLLSNFPEADSPLNKSETRRIGYCCLRCGVLELVVRTDKCGYDVNGDVVKLEVSVNNKSKRKVRGVTARLVGTTTFKAEGVIAKSHLKISEQRWGEGVLPKSSCVWKTKLPVMEYIHQLRPSHLGGGCSLIDLEWHVRVIAEVKGRNNNVTVVCPILLGTRVKRRKSKDY